MSDVSERVSSSAGVLPDRASSSQSSCTSRSRQLGKSERKAARKRRHDSSTSSSSSSSDSSDSESDSSAERHRRRRRRKRKKREKRRLKKREKKRLKKLEKQQRQCGPCEYQAGNDTQIGPAVPTSGVGQAMRPMTKQEWEKQSSELRHVIDPHTGRKRLVRGTGEIVEEIVSSRRQREINKLATQQDGQNFQQTLARVINKQL